MLVRWLAGCAVGLILCCTADLAAGKSELPHFPGAALLVGYDSLFSGSPSLFLAVTTPSETLMVLPEPGQPETRNGTPTYPSISPDGTLVGCLRVKSTDPKRVVVATYSIPDKKWTEYAEAYDVLGVAISPDKSEVAFVSIAQEGQKARLYVLNTRTGLKQALPVEAHPLDGHLTWSPDGQHIAYEVRLSPSAANAYQSAIDVIDLATETARRLSSGQDPAWSPSGEWIAYLDSFGTWPVSTKCMAAHPDGTGEQVLYGFHRPHALFPQCYFIYPPVWSPDSKELLLNEQLEWSEPVVNEKVNVHLLNFASHKLTTKFRHAPPVLGWALWK